MAICRERNEETNKEIIGPCFQTAIQPYDFELLMQQRRSIRDFKEKDIPNEIIEEFIHRMRFSPTASNAQSLSFTVIKDKAILKAVNDLTIQTLSKAFKQGVNSYTKWLINLFLGKRTFELMLGSKIKFLQKASIDSNMICYNAPAMVIIHAPQSLTGMPLHDANIWMGMAMLYAPTLELSTCVNGYVINAAKRNKAVKRILQIPDHHIICGALLIGYPKMKYTNRVDRKIPNINFI